MNILDQLLNFGYARFYEEMIQLRRKNQSLKNFYAQITILSNNTLEKKSIVISIAPSGRVFMPIHLILLIINRND